MAAGTLGEAAAEISYADTATIFSGPSHIHLNDALRAHQASLAFKALNVTTSVRNYHLTDVLFDARTNLLWHDGNKLTDTDYFAPNGVHEAPRPDAATLVRLDGNHDFIIGYNNVHAAYQHWVTQCIPAIDWSMRQRRRQDACLVLPHLARWQEDFLDLLGYGSVPRFTTRPDRIYSLPHATYSAFLNGSASFGVCPSLIETARRIAHAIPARQSPYKVLYVPCADPYYGSIQNEAEVIALLRRHNVHVVNRQNLGTAERINLFRGAEAVIGPLGAGLTDILFCQPNALLWEWMPRHHQNASFNRLAQAAHLNYWGSLFETVGEAVAPAPWRVDLAELEAGLAEITARRPARRDREADGRYVTHSATPPIDELITAFESLGDNCEFGLLQRHCGVEPASLLRFAGIEVPGELRIDKMVAALEKRFAGLGAEGTLIADPAGKPGEREFIVRESVYALMSHTFIQEKGSNREDLLVREAKRMKFFRLKLLADLAVGRRIWVWKSADTPHRHQVEPLLRVLRDYGPNILLWVVEADPLHPPGTVERIESDFIQGYVTRFAPYEDASAIDHVSWLELCQGAYRLAGPRRRSSAKPPAEMRETAPNA